VWALIVGITIVAAFVPVVLVDWSVSGVGSDLDGSTLGSSP